MIGIIQTAIPDDLLTEARQLARQMGTLRNSITKGAGNVYGFVGELVATRYLGALHHNTHDYDVVLPAGPQGFRVDVKTKKVTSKPKPNYLCTVADYNTRQQCDAYVFTRVMDDFSYAYLLGWLTKEQFYKEAKFFKRGDIDPSGNGKWKFTADCYNVQIDQLRPMGVLLDEDVLTKMLKNSTLTTQEICQPNTQTTGIIETKTGL
jgi:hypothetical protein